MDIPRTKNLLENFETPDLTSKDKILDLLYKGVHEETLNRISILKNQFDKGIADLKISATRDVPVGMATSEIINRISVLKAAHINERNLFKEIETLQTVIDDINDEIQWRQEPERIAAFSDAVTSAKNHFTASKEIVDNAEDDLKFSEAIFNYFYSISARDDIGELSYQESYTSRHGGSSSKDPYNRSPLMDRLRSKYDSNLQIGKGPKGDYVISAKLSAKIYPASPPSSIIDIQSESSMYLAMGSFERARYSAQESLRACRQRVADAKIGLNMATQFVVDESLKHKSELRAIEGLKRTLSRNMERMNDAQSNYFERLLSISEEIVSSSIEIAKCAQQLRKICKHFGVTSQVPEFDIDRDVLVGDELYVSRFSRMIQEAIYELEKKRSRLVRTHHVIKPQWQALGDFDVCIIDFENNAAAGYLSGIFLIGEPGESVDAFLYPGKQQPTKEQLATMIGWPAEVHAPLQNWHELPSEAAMLRTTTSSVSIMLKKRPHAQIMILARKDWASPF